MTTATHPTTSTQTRSTARPQNRMHAFPSHMRSLRPIPLSNMHLSTFDRYLPCNSHHIREAEQPQQPPPSERPSRGHQFDILRSPPVQRRTPFQFRSASASGRRPTLFTAESPTTASAAVASVSARLLLNESELNTMVPIFGSDHVQLRVRDFINLTPSPNTLNRIRTTLRTYITNTLLRDAPLTENVINIVSLIMI